MDSTGDEAPDVREVHGLVAERERGRRRSRKCKTHKVRNKKRKERLKMAAGSRAVPTP